MRGHSDTNWAKEYQQWIAIWKERHKYVLIGQPILRKIKHMNWYQENSRIFLTGFATYPNVGATSCLAPNMEAEQHPWQNWTTSSTAKSTSGYQHAWWRTTTTCSIILIHTIIHVTTLSSSTRLWVQSTVLQCKRRRLYEQFHGYRSSNIRVNLCVHEKYAHTLVCILSPKYCREFFH